MNLSEVALHPCSLFLEAIVFREFLERAMFPIKNLWSLVSAISG